MIGSRSYISREQMESIIEIFGEDILLLDHISRYYTKNGNFRQQCSYPPSYNWVYRDGEFFYRSLGYGVIPCINREQFSNLLMGYFLEPKATLSENIELAREVIPTLRTNVSPDLLPVDESRFLTLSQLTELEDLGLNLTNIFTQYRRESRVRSEVLSLPDNPIHEDFHINNSWIKLRCRIFPLVEKVNLCRYLKVDEDNSCSLNDLYNLLIDKLIYGD